MKNWRNIAYLGAEAARSEIEQLTTDIAVASDPRRRRKLARRLAFAGTSIAFLPTLGDMSLIETGLSALRLARRSGAATDDLNRSIAWLSKARLELMGCLNTPVLAEAKKMVTTDAACLACSGAEYLDRDLLAGEKAETLAAMNRGDFFLVATGADGRYGVTLRIVDAPEPVLTRNEYKRLDTATEIGLIRIDGATLRFGAAENLTRGAIVDAQPGLMKVQAFSLGARIALVACAAKEPPLALTDFPVLV